jgi:TPP-dependent pyruvate/acetoin dehydrogenase alpha subunit
MEASLLLKMYECMVLARCFDNIMVKLQRIGRIAAYTSSEGQEAVAVGAAKALRETDWIFPTYRETGAYIVRGVPLDILIARQFATAYDPLKGHEVLLFGDKRYRIVTGPGPVAAHICTSTGFALASKYRSEDVVVLTFFGEGATSKGDFHEGVNFAALFKAPIVFVCQNNQYAISTPISRQTASESIAIKAEAYGIEGKRIDGNDVVEVYQTVKQAVEKARNGGGPTLIEAVTYRLAAHSTADDPSRYRNNEEVEGWRRRDPLKLCRQLLEKMGLWNVERENAFWRRCEQEIMLKVEDVTKQPPIYPQAIFDDVYATPLWHLLEEAENLKQTE